MKKKKSQKVIQQQAKPIALEKRNSSKRLGVKCSGCSQSFMIEHMQVKKVDQYTFKLGIPMYLLNNQYTFNSQQANIIDQYGVYCHKCYKAGKYFEHFNYINVEHFNHCYEEYKKSDLRKIEVEKEFLETQIKTLNQIIEEEKQKQVKVQAKLTQKHNIIEKFGEEVLSLKMKFQKVITTYEDYIQFGEREDISKLQQALPLHHYSFEDDVKQLHLGIEQINKSNYSEFQLQISERDMSENLIPDLDLMVYPVNISWQKKNATLKNIRKDIQRITKELELTCKNINQQLIWKQQQDSFREHQLKFKQHYHQYKFKIECDGCKRELFIENIRLKKTNDNFWSLGLNFYIFNTLQTGKAKYPKRKDKLFAFCIDCYNKDLFEKSFIKMYSNSLPLAKIKQSLYQVKNIWKQIKDSLLKIKNFQTSVIKNCKNMMDRILSGLKKRDQNLAIKVIMDFLTLKQQNLSLCQGQVKYPLSIPKKKNNIMSVEQLQLRKQLGKLVFKLQTFGDFSDYEIKQIKYIVLHCGDLAIMDSLQCQYGHYYWGEDELERYLQPFESMNKKQRKDWSLIYTSMDGFSKGGVIVNKNDPDFKSIIQYQGSARNYWKKYKGQQIWYNNMSKRVKYTEQGSFIEYLEYEEQQDQNDQDQSQQQMRISQNEKDWVDYPEYGYQDQNSYEDDQDDSSNHEEEDKQEQNEQNYKEYDWKNWDQTFK